MRGQYQRMSWQVSAFSPDSDFARLDPRIQKWVYKQGWDDLRDIQKKSISPILAGDRDVVISASTAAGKTEAAFLPACSLAADEKGGFGILYISPLKALINDQYRRLEGLCDDLDMTVTAWHGDSSQAKKKNVKRDPEGILLITPESLESLMIREPGWVKSAFETIQCSIIDEYHAFVGFERGCHLQSLMHRLEALLDRPSQPMPRIALSATLGDMDSVQSYLRPSKSIPCQLIEGKQDRNTLKMQVRGYLEEFPSKPHDPDELNIEPWSADEKIACDLFETLRGESHLVFANSRRRTENFAVLLSELCEQHYVPNEFFPHHGSLSKELRSELETRLHKENLPTTAVCTMTLELGIDIGKVQSIAQVTAPHSVASLRQRLGRSGRRGEPAILRMYISENELNVHSSLGDKLRLELMQSIAMLRLLLRDKWYEPPDTHLYHFSTLLHQTLAVIAQWGGVRPDQIWGLLCKSGPFRRTTVDHFKTLLTHMGEIDLIVQLNSGELVLGKTGERLVNHYSFYSVFKTPEEYRIVVEGKTLGTLPIDSMILPDQHIVFGGRRWKVKDIDCDKKTIFVTPAKGGRPPKFGGDGLGIHDRIRQEMYVIYRSGDHRISIADAKLDFMDEIGQNLFQEGLKYFRDINLESKRIVQYGDNTYIVPWMGDKLINTLVAMLKYSGYEAGAYAGIIEINNVNKTKINECLKSIVSSPIPSNTELSRAVKNKQSEKFDHLLPEKLLNVSCGAKAFDAEKTVSWLAEIL